MRATLLMLLLGVLAVPSELADKSVKGYVRKDGTYVSPHVKSNPNSQRFDNYSSRGNVNPYTGGQGSKPSEFTNPPAYNKPKK